MPEDVTLTILTGEGAATAAATLDDDRLRIAADAVQTTTGWTMKPEGLCRADSCIPLRQPGAVDDAGRIDLAAVASALRRPMAVEQLAGDAVAALGDAAAERADAMRNLEAPAFELPTVDGGTVSLDDFASTKRLLLAWASW